MPRIESTFPACLTPLLKLLGLPSFLVIIFLCIAQLHAEETQQVAMPVKHQALLRNHCQKCHNQEKSEGKFRVDNLPYSIDTLETAERWQKILNALNSGEMPPEGEKPLEGRLKTDLLDDLANVMVAARKKLSDQKGVITMRRLNRREYKNTLRELLGVEVNVSELPADNGTGTFDTVGSNLFMSSNQFEQYLALGREALEEALEWRAAAAEKQSLHFEAEETLTRIKKFWDDEMEAHERGKKWAAEVMAAAARPENSAVVAELKKSAKDDAMLRRSWDKIVGAPSPESFGFRTVENNADKANRAANNVFMHPYYRYYLEQPHLDTGAYLTISAQDLNSPLVLNIPPKWPVGNYLVRVRLGAVPDAAPERRFVEFGVHPRHGQILKTFEITGTIAEPQTIEIPFTITRKHNDRDNRALFIREKGTSDHFLQTRYKFNEGRKLNGIGPVLAIWVDWMEIERLPNDGKQLAPGMEALADLSFSDKQTAPTVNDLRAPLERFATVAFRGRQPTASYTERLLKLYEFKLKMGDKPSAALKDVLAVVLSSPMFLYLSEPTQDQPHRSLNEYELATRLSYFLWGAPPDKTLQNLAARGELSKPETLKQQVNRLLDDPRSEGFVTPFVYQWLGLDRLDFFQVDRMKYPRFDDTTKLSARNEVYQTFSHLLRENGSLRDLLKADYVVIDGILANYYGIPDVHGSDFRKVAIPADSPRGGLLGMAAINLMGGNGEKTSPVERGAWVLRKLINDPPPPAPANVPQIARLAGKLLTTRERLIAHQEEAQCASCHRKIDPIGFGLENFDAVGQWRTTDTYQVTDSNGKPDPKLKKTWTIDPAAKLYQGPEFKDYFELRDIISTKSEPFARGFSSALVEYGLGRPAGFSDEPLIAEMVEQAKQNQFALRQFILTLVASKEFHTK